MRFGLEESSDEDDVASLDYSISSDGSFNGSPSHNPRSSLARDILAAYESSGSELDSEDEVDMLGLGDEWDVVKKRAEEKPSWREAKDKSKVLPSNSKLKGRGKIPPITWTSVSRNKQLGSSTSGKIDDLSVDEPNEYDRWVQLADQQAWREGQKQAQERRGEMRTIASNARARIKGQEENRLAKEADDLRKMLEGMTLKHDKEEEELARKFAEREKKLWADIDAAIKEVEKRETELAAAALAAARRKKEEEAARAAAAERIAVAQKSENEKRAREQADKERQDGEARAAEERRLAAQREEEEAREKASAEKGKAGQGWSNWVERQKWIKSEVIEPVKADRATKTALRPGMRLMTRGLGQVVNTKDSIIRVTDDIHNILSQQLPSPPSSATPFQLDESVPKPYAYLLSHLSKALIKQAESEVNAKPDAAFPLARIVIGLLLRGHAALGEVLYTRFVKKCPWVVPFYPTRQPNQPREEFEKSTGRGADESLAEYISRMAGICTLYFAILQTPISSLIPTVPAPPTPAQLESLINPTLRFPSAWTWLAVSLKDPMPSSPPMAHLISAWIEVLAHEAVRVFGTGQMGKVWEVIERDGLDGGKIKGDSEAARQRLRLVLGTWRKGEVEIPKGRVWE